MGGRLARSLRRMELIHTCYRIGEIDRSVAFYEALGFEERRRMPIREEAINVFMGLPGDGDRLELTYNYGVDSYELGTGYNHIALTVDDLDGTLAALAEQGIEPEKPPYRCARAARGSASCATRTATGSSSSSAPERGQGASTGISPPRRVGFRPWSAGSPSSTSARTPSGSSSSPTPTTGGSGRTRSTSPCASARSRRPAGRSSPSRWSARSRRSSCSPTSAARRGIERVRPLATSAIREASQPRGVPPARARALGARDRGPLARGGGALRLPRRRQLDDARRRRRARHRRRLDAAHPASATGARCDDALVAARRGRDDRALPRGRRRSSPSSSRRCARTCATSSRARRGWLGDTARRLDGVGGTVRNLAAAAMLAEELPSYGVQGFCLRRAALDELVDERSPSGRPRERRKMPGHQAGARRPDPRRRRRDPDRDGASAASTRSRSTEAGLREGAFFDELLAGEDAPLFPDVREAAVRNLAAQYHPERAAHGARRAGSRSRSGTRSRGRGVHPGDPEERELLWAAAMLHDVGTAVDYDDHHKHSRYLILNAGLPGLLTARDRADRPDRPLPPQGPARRCASSPRSARKGDEALLARCATALRLAEQLERPRDQTVRHADVVVDGDRVELRLRGDARRHRRRLGRAAPGRPLPARVRPRAHRRRLTTASPRPRAHGANCMTWWMPLGRFVYCMSTSGIGEKATFTIGRFQVDGSVLPWRCGLARRGLASIAAHRSFAHAPTLPLPQ